MPSGRVSHITLLFYRTHLLWDVDPIPSWWNQLPGPGAVPVTGDYPLLDRFLKLPSGKAIGGERLITVKEEREAEVTQWLPCLMGRVTSRDEGQHLCSLVTAGR